METIGEIGPLRELLRSWRKKGRTIGLVPTMGFLHDGHVSLIKRSMADNDLTVVSVFVNPTQFAPGEDYTGYPRNIGGDSKICRSLGIGAVFNPGPSEMYPDGFCARVEMAGLSAHLCGRSRPTHFQGVCTVVLKLLNIVTPDRAYFGLKDAQQYFILARMAADLNLEVDLVPCPIVREPDGLAMSSRNSYLSPEERGAATVLSKGLLRARDELMAGERSVRTVLDLVRSVVSSEPLAALEYLEAVDTAWLKPVRTKVETETLFALACRFGRTRLIDNVIFDPGFPPSWR